MMRTYLNRAGVAGLLALLLGVSADEVLPVWAQAPARSKETSALAGCQTPQKAFAAAQQALKKGDWKAYFNLCDEFSVNVYAGQLVAWYSMRFLATPDELESQPIEGKRDFARMEKVLEKHGLTEEDCRRFLKDQPKFPELNFTSAWFRRIKDKPSFNSEMIAAMRSHHDYWEEAQGQFTGACLEGLKIDGDKATADVHFSDGRTEKVEFRRVKGAWLLLYPDPTPEPSFYGATDKLPG